MFRKTGWGLALVALLIAGSIWAILPLDKIPLGIDLSGGMELLYRLDTSTLPPEAVPGIAEKAKEIMSRRLDKYGLKEISISIAGNDRLLIQIPGLGTEETRSIQDTIEKAGVLNFHLVALEAEQTPERIKEIKREWETYWQELKAAQQGKTATAPPEPTRLAAEEIRESEEEGGKSESKPTGRTLVLHNEPDMKVEGRLLRDAYPTIDTETNTPAVGFEFGGEGASRFSDLTRRFIKRQLAIVLDEAVVSAPVIQDTIGARGIIKGRFTDREVRTLSNILRVGSLPADPIKEQEHLVGSVLGQDSITRGFRAAILGLVLVVAFMLVYYMKGGFIAILALLFNTILVLAYTAVFRQTVTFPGIAGIVLGIGMAVDANILIFERVREELKKGKSILQAMGNAYRRVFWTIFDSNVTTIITGIVLFKLGTGAVKGFAVTLIAGLIANFFTAVYFTRLSFSWMYNRGLLKNLRMLQVFETPHIDFLGKKRIFVGFSTVMCLLAVALVIYRGASCLGIDFTGGTRIMISLNRPMQIGEFREVVHSIRESGETSPFRDAEIQTVGDVTREGEAMGFTIRTRLAPAAASGSAAEEVPAPAPAKSETPGEKNAAEAPAAAPAAPAGAPPQENPQDRLRRLLEETLGPHGKNLLAPAAFPVEKLVSPLPLPAEEEQKLEGKKHVYIEFTFRRPVQTGTAEPGSSDPEKVAGEIKKLLDADLGRRGFTIPFEVGILPDSQGQAGYFGRGYVSAGPVDWDAVDRPANVRAVSAPVKDALQRMRTYAVSEPFPAVDTISGKVASDMQANALIAIIVSLVAIVFYVGLRFDFQFGVAAIVPLFHDVLVSLGILVLTDFIFGSTYAIKVDLAVVAALLTIVGYSLNDTIVIFDRIRENLGRPKKGTFEDLVNESVNETLSRTIWTALTVFFVVLTLLIFGGEPIRGFAFAMVFGTVAGSYSTIYIAGPVLIYLRHRKEEKIQRAKEAARAAG